MTPLSYMAKAQRALAGARALLDVADTEGACSRAYYAMHDAAHAALLALGHESRDAPIKTHHGLIAAFGKTVVVSGRLDAVYGRSFNRVQAIRLLADYSAEPPSMSDATLAVEQAESFLAAVRGLVTS